MEPPCSRHHKRTKRGVFQGQEAGEGSHRGIIVEEQASALVCEAARCKVVLDALRLDVVCDVCAVGTQGAAQWTCTRQTSGLDCHNHVHAASCAMKHAGCQSALNMPNSWQRTVRPFRYLCPGKVSCQAYTTAFLITGCGCVGQDGGAHQQQW